jgi:hypothetical protein
MQKKLPGSLAQVLGATAISGEAIGCAGDSFTQGRRAVQSAASGRPRILDVLQ